MEAIEDDTGSADTTYADPTATEVGVRYVYRVKALRGAAKIGRSNYVRIVLTEALATPTPAYWHAAGNDTAGVDNGSGGRREAGPDLRESLDGDSEPAASAFTVTVGGDARAVDAVSVEGSGVTLTLASAVTSDDTVAVSYTAPADAAAPRIRDMAGNAAASFSGQTVANNTEEVVITQPDEP